MGIIDTTTDRGILRTECRRDPAAFEQDTDAMLDYVRHAAGAVKHNITLMHNVKRWPEGADKRRNLRALRDNVNSWRAKVATVIEAYRARCDVYCAIVESSPG